MREREEALAVRDHAAPAAVRARARRRSGLGPAAATDVTGGLDLHGHADLHPRERVLERDPDARLEVGAALRARPPGALASSEERAEVAENVRQVAEVDVLEPAAFRAEAARRPFRAEAVVRLPLLGIREDVVGSLDVLEPLLRGRVARVAVRVELAGELAVRLLDLVVGRRLRDAEDVVGIRGVPLDHHSATTTRAGRSTTSPSRYPRWMTCTT